MCALNRNLSDRHVQGTPPHKTSAQEAPKEPDVSPLRCRKQVSHFLQSQHVCTPCRPAVHTQTLPLSLPKTGEGTARVSEASNRCHQPVSHLPCPLTSPVFLVCSCQSGKRREPRPRDSRAPPTNRISFQMVMHVLYFRGEGLLTSQGGVGPSPVTLAPGEPAVMERLCDPSDPKPQFRFSPTSSPASSVFLSSKRPPPGLGLQPGAQCGRPSDG